MAEKLTGSKRQAAMRDLHGWAEVPERDAIRKTFHFPDFSAAWGFMTRVALIAEKRDDHPEWFNAYNRVEIVLSTHDAEGVTLRDVDFAHHIDRIGPNHDR